MSFDISELLTLYDVVTFSFPERYEDLMREIIEKATRLFGVRRLAIVLREGERYKCIERWGFRRDEEVLERIKNGGENSFIYLMRNGEQGLLYIEPPGRISEREKRLYTIFARRIENIIARKQIEEKIKNSEQEKKVILDSIVELLVFQNPDNRILWANRAAAEYAGARSEELAGRFCYEALHHRDEPCEECPVIKALDTGVPQEGIIASLEGRQFFVRGYPVKKENGLIEGIVEVSVDVTERMQAEEAFRTIFNSVHDAIFIHTLDGKIIDVNQTMLRMYVINSKEEAIKLSIIDDYSIPGSTAEQLPLLWQKVISGENLLFEWKARRPVDGSVFDVEVFLKKISLSKKDVILAAVRDITERKREEELLRNLFTHSPIGMYIVSEGKFQLINPQFEILTGYRQDKLIGMESLNLVVPEDRKMVRSNAIKMLKGEAVEPYEFRIVTGQGDIRWMEETVASIWHDGKRVTLGNIIDITQKKKFEQKLAYISLHDQLTALYNRAYFEEELKRLSTSRKYPITIIVADVNGLKLVNDTMGHDKGDELLTACARVLKKAFRSLDVVARVGGDEFVALLPRTDGKTGKSILKRLRLFIDKYNQEHPELPLSVSFGIATADTPEQSLKEIYKKADDLMYQEKLNLGSSARSKIVNALLTALSERDYITEGHARRMQKLCQDLGEKVGLSAQQLANLSLLAQVHDLGKVGIPDRILFKRGPLTEKEWEVMRQHPEKGYRIAMSSPDLAGIADLILKHHEKWDGTGYPLGLKEEEIPIECRILSIVDAFDAMTSGRPYCRTKTIEDALKEIRRCAGTQFDPRLAEAFIEMITSEKFTAGEKKVAT
ncbi:cyclic di-GMP phosphodiesterase response regulator RpfG [Moorella thermoacetica]|uniref:PAS domain S-box protein n=1 Tax=Neomoorella thermoacetica TaxID=1525 RepID=UPI00069EF229|nr:PAS domain S-box protein [Moorella thermoacetica]AKX93433.1 cyclic di-GMP phosphodiesterase response regulator RpfG [Moorella thermoacetica]